MKRPPRNPVGEPREGKLNLSSLVDISFLLLIYFLVTSTLLPKEGDLNLELPVPPENLISDPFRLEPLAVALDANGAIAVDNQVLESDPAARSLPRFNAKLLRYKAICDAADRRPLVIVSAHDDATHQRFTDLINSLAEAGIKEVTLSDFR